MRFVNNFKRITKGSTEERKKVLEFIANNAAKKEFIEWLNANYQQQFPEDADWEQLQSELKKNDNIRISALHNYAGTLTDKSDVSKLLKDVEKETTKAEAVVTELYDSADTKRLRPIAGGACMLGGILLILIAAGLLTGTLDMAQGTDLRNYLIAMSGVYGLLNVFAGILLVSE